MEERTSALLKVKGELDTERKQLFDNIVKLEAQLKQKDKDLSLKDAKLESYESMMQKREEEHSQGVSKLE